MGLKFLSDQESWPQIIQEIKYQKAQHILLEMLDQDPLVE